MKSPHAHAAQCANWRARQRDRQRDLRIESLIQENQRLADRVTALEARDFESVVALNQQLTERVVKLADEVAVLRAERRESVIEQNQIARQSAPSAEPRVRVEDITPSILPLVSKKPKTPPIVPPIEFEAWWAGWPNKVDKKAAMAEYARARRKVSAEALKAGVQRYIDTKPAEWQWCGPARWLRNERWNDQPAVQPQPTRTYAQQSYGGLI
jgi:hypothetical protein